MNDGWLKIYRKLTDWEWYTNSEMVHLFLHLLIKASPTDKKWQGLTVKRGQVIIGRQKLSADTGISERTIRTCLSHLVESGEITIKATNRYSIITVCKYADYQPAEIQIDQPTDQPTDQQGDQPNGQQTDQPTDQPTDHILRSKENNNIPSSTPTDVGEKEVPKSKKTSKRKKPEDYTIVTKGRAVFEAFYKKLFETDYVWSPTEAALMKNLTGKITSSRKTRGMPLDDDSIVDGLSQFLESITDQWILEHLSLDIIVKNYNRIRSQAWAEKSKNNGTNSTNPQGSTGASIVDRQRAACENDIAKADELYFKQLREQGGRRASTDPHAIPDSK